MEILRNPVWLDEIVKIDWIESENIVFYSKIINDSLYYGEDPILSIIIPMKNEERNVLRCVYSISKNICKVPYEIIVVDNGSTDRSVTFVENLGIRLFRQPMPGVGAARELGQQQARGKYVLQTDADCVYPPYWIENVYSFLSDRSEVICCFGRYSFISTNNLPRWKLSIFENVKSFMADFRNWKRPHLNAYGMNLAYIKEFGLAVKFDTRPIRGEDGRLVYEFNKLGKVKYLRASKFKIWADARALSKYGSFTRYLWKKGISVIFELPSLFFKRRDHDPKQSYSQPL